MGQGRHPSGSLVAVLVAILALATGGACLAATAFEDGFEGGWGSWYADNGVWQVGTPTYGPTAAHGGSTCAGTVLGGTYPADTASRLVSPTITLPIVTQGEEIWLRFWEWFEYEAGGDWGEVQISVWVLHVGWSDWVTLATFPQGSSPGWSLAGVELTAYRGAPVRIAFRHTANYSWEYAGWYLDDISVWYGAPQFSLPEGFELGWGDWHTDNGVWQVGTPTYGPPGAQSGASCAGTILDGPIPDQTASRLVSPTITVPMLTEGEEIWLRFWETFDYSIGDDWGEVQVSERLGDGTWSAWATLAAFPQATSEWSLAGVELTAYAGKAVRIAFLHVSGWYGSSWGLAGWYVDDVTLWYGRPEFRLPEGFELGWGDWHTDNGVWQVGTPYLPAGPAEAHSGGSCAGTVFDVDYTPETDSRLISPTVTLPTLTEGEEIWLRFWEWFGYQAGYDWGEVQVSERLGDGTWSEWVTLTTCPQDASPWWSLAGAELTAYGGKTVRIAFLHVSTWYGWQSQYAGWYVDDVTVWCGTPEFRLPERFEFGWGDWHAENGIWQVGAPTYGPLAAHSGALCAGTIVDGTYPPYTASRLVSPTIALPTLEMGQEIWLRFWQWFEYESGYDTGEVQLSERLFDGTWSEWAPLSSYTGSSGAWTYAGVELTAYGGKSIRVAFRHAADYALEYAGWYLDDVTITLPTPPLPQADFTSDVTAGPAPLTVHFTDLSTGNPTSWLWDFGDGGSSAERDPVHPFLTPGAYTVSLTAGNAGGVATETKTDYITVLVPPPVAGFSASPTRGPAPLTVTFTDLSTGGPASWAWDFGDGGTSTARNPAHQYSAPGSYTVRLTVSNSSGSDEETKPGYITVLPPPPVADFSASPRSGSPPLTVSFTDLSTGNATSWWWSFGDGGTSAARNPAHQYTVVGSYTVSLRVSNPGGSDTETKENYIVVAVPPVAEFTADPREACVGAEVRFTDLSTGSPTSWLWAFGDGSTSTERNPIHEYTRAGTYTVSLTVTNVCGSDTETKAEFIAVAVGPNADFSASPTGGPEGVVVQFTDLSTGGPTFWVWDFGDGGTSGEQNPSHQYHGAGRYTVSLTVGNGSCSDTETKSDYITVWGVVRADFAGSPREGTAPLAVSFTDLSTNGPTSWLWDLGDGSTSHEQNPTHEYARPGFYAVTLTATGLPGSYTETKMRYIAVGFPDAGPGHWAFRQIVACYTDGIVGGFPDGSYRPDLVVSRDQMAVYISRALCGGDASVPSGPAQPRFPDVGAEHWAYKYIMYAVSQNVVQGYPDGDYRPELAVDRGQMAVFIARALVAPRGDAGLPSPPKEATFRDVTGEQLSKWYWCYRHVEYIAARGVTQGYPDGCYHPERQCTRDQMAVYIQRAFGLPTY